MNPIPAIRFNALICSRQYLLSARVVIERPA